MRNDLIVSKSIVINSAPDRVWDVLTNPELIKEYLFGTETVTTWEKGSEVIFQGNYNGHQYQDHGVVLENSKNEKLIYSYWSGFSGTEDKPENYSKITYSLKMLGVNETEFTWTQQGYSTEDNYNHSLTGITDLIKKIKEIAERE